MENSKEVFESKSFAWFNSFSNMLPWTSNLKFSQWSDKKIVDYWIIGHDMMSTREYLYWPRQSQPRSIGLFSGWHHSMSNYSTVDNCIIFFLLFPARLMFHANFLLRRQFAYRKQFAWNVETCFWEKLKYFKILSAEILLGLLSFKKYICQGDSSES